MFNARKTFSAKWMTMLQPHLGRRFTTLKKTKECEIDSLKKKKDEKWKQPLPFQKTGADVQPLSKKMVPETLYDFALDQAYSFNNAAPEFIISSTLACASALIGTSSTISPKQHDKSWRVSQALWCLNIASPSMLKSPTMKVAVRLLKHAQQVVIDTNNKTRSATAASKEKQSSLAFSKANRALELEKGAEGHELLLEAEKLKSEVPLQRNIVINDCTPEALLLHVQSNPNGCLVLRDELYGWLWNQERGDNTSERALYTEAFEGSNSLIQKRISREQVSVNNMYVGVLGCIQPDRVRPILAGRENGKSNDGFFERFQLAIFSEAKMKYTDVSVVEALVDKMQHVFCCLASLKENEIEIEAHFSEEAQTLWNDWASAQATCTEQAENQMQSVMGKYPSLVAKLSLIYHLMTEATECHNYHSFSPTSTVQLESLAHAIEFSKLLLSHNARIQQFVSPDNESNIAELISERLTELPEEFALRDLQRKNWCGLVKAQQCLPILKQLEAHGYIRSFTPGHQARKTAVRYQVNPLWLDKQSKN
jgi:hypothetical protein